MVESPDDGFEAVVGQTFTDEELDTLSIVEAVGDATQAMGAPIITFEDFLAMAAEARRHVQPYQWTIVGDVDETYPSGDIRETHLRGAVLKRIGFDTLEEALSAASGNSTHPEYLKFLESERENAEEAAKDGGTYSSRVTLYRILFPDRERAIGEGASPELIQDINGDQTLFCLTLPPQGFE